VANISCIFRTGTSSTISRKYAEMRWDWGQGYGV